MMSEIPLDIISTGSDGNAVVINRNILIDCGVCFKALENHYKALKLVLLTHIHGDHFNKSTLRLLAGRRPTLRFACCAWLVRDLLACGVPAANIDVLEFDVMYAYGICNVIPIPLSHDVPNCGWKIHLPAGKVIYATDTCNLNGITARNYDLFLIEANYIDEEIQEKIREKEANGEFVYERRVLRTHLSKAKCDDFICRNIGITGKFVYMHRHID